MRPRDSRPSHSPFTLFRRGEENHIHIGKKHGNQLTPSSPNKQTRLNVPAELLEYNEEDERDSLNSSSGWSRSNPAGTTKLSINQARLSDMLDQKENFCYLWIVLSTLYGHLLVVLMVAFCLIEVMDNSVRLLSLQGIFLMYLYVGSIAVIIAIYIWVLVDSCSSFSGDADESITTSVVGDTEIGRLTLSRFGSLKRAHITKDATSTTSFYLRIGALAFGLGTLVFNGLEMAMHSMMEGPCLNDVVFVHPVLHGLFTFLQMHFLFVNSQVLVEKFGLIARFGFMHLTATNLALWMRLVVWESGIEWTYYVHLAQSMSSYSLGSASSIIPTPLHLKGFPKYFTAALSRVERDTLFYHNLSQDRYARAYQPISDSHIRQVVALHNCLNTNTLGQLWTSSMPFLYPFIVQFSLIAAGVTYVMGQNVGRDRIPCIKLSKKCSSNTNTVGKLGPNCIHDVHHYHHSGPQIDCSGASKGLFLGLLCLVASIVVIIIFLVVKEDDGFPTETLFWITSGTLGTILLLSVLVTVPGLVQIRKLCHTGKSPMMLDTLLSNISLCGVQLYSVFGIVVGASEVYVAPAYSLEQRQHIMLLTISSLQLVQSVAQSTLIAEGLRRGAITRYQLLTTPARQVITFLLCSNIALWALDSFVTQSWLSQELQLKFMGVLAWGVISRIALPLLVFYRFHSGVLLLEVWQHAYSKGRMDLGS